MRTARLATSFLFALAPLASSSGAQTLRLNDTLPESLAGGSPRDFAVSADGQWIVFRGDIETTGVIELWSVPADHSAPPSKLSASLVSGGGVGSYSLVGTRAVYRADAFVDQRFELFSLPIDGSAAPTHLTNKNVVQFAPTPDGARIVFRTSSELFSVPIDGSAAPVELMNSTDTCSAFYIAPAGGRVVARWNGAVDEYRSQSVLGTGPVTVIDTTVQDGNASEEVRFSHDGTRFFHEGTFSIPYQAYRELRSAPVDGSAPAVFLAAYDFEWALNWAVTSDGASVVLGIDNVYRVPSGGGSLVSLADPSGLIDWIALTPDQGVLFSYHLGLNSVALAHVPVDGSQPYTDIPAPVGRTLNQPGSALFTPGGSHVLFSDWKAIYSLSTSWNSPPLALASIQQVTAPEEIPRMRLLSGGTDVAFAASVLQDCNTGWTRKELYRRPIDGSGPLVRLDRLTGEGVTTFALAEGGLRAVYLHASNPENPSPLALYGVAVEGATPPRLYHEPQNAPPTVGDVTDSWVSSDGSVVIYRADQESNEKFGLYAVSLSEPGKRVRLCEQEATTTVRLSADGTRVAFVTRRGSFDVLYCAPTDGSEPAVFIEQVYNGSDLFSFDPALSSDGEFVVYDLPEWQLVSTRSDGSTPKIEAGPTDMLVSDIGLDETTQRVFFTGTVNGNNRMYAMPVDASQPAIRIVPQGGTPPPLTGALASGGLVYYLRTTAGVNEVYAVPIDGSALPERLSSPLVAGGSVASFLVQDGVVLYRADGTVDERIDLYRSTGPSTSITLASMPGTTDVQPDIALSPDGTRVFYRADPQLPGRIDLFSVASDGSSAPVTLATPTGVFDVASFAVSADGNLVAFGQEDGDAPLVDLWTVPAAGGTAVQVESRVRAFAFTPEFELVCSVEPASGPFEVVAHKLVGRRKVLATLLDTVPVTTLAPLPGERVVWRGAAREAGVTELFLSFTGLHIRTPQRPNAPPGNGGTIVR